MPNAETVAAVHSFMKSGLPRRTPVRRIGFTFADRGKRKPPATQLSPRQVPGFGSRDDPAGAGPYG